MKVQGNEKPLFSFTVINYDGSADLIFRENIEDISPEDAPSTLFQWNEYHLKRKWTTSIYDEVMANYDTWLNAAKLEDEKRTSVDLYQLRADVDFLSITQMAAYGISTLSAGEPQSDPEVLDMAERYYPNRWSKERLYTLMNLGKIIQADYERITGEELDSIAG